MSMDSGTGALIGCFGSFGTVDVGSETIIGTGAKGGGRLYNCFITTQLVISYLHN